MAKIVLIKSDNQVVLVNYEIYKKVELKEISSKNELNVLINNYIETIKIQDEKNFEILINKAINSLDEVLEYLISNYPNKNIMKALKQKPYSTFYIILEQIYTTYYTNYLKNLSLEELINLTIDINNNKDFIKTKDIKIPNYIAEEAFINAINKKIFFNTTHKCFDYCINACTNKCPKIKNKVKKSIREYSFIKKGFQIKDGLQTERLVVLECEKYQKEKAEEYKLKRELKRINIEDYLPKDNISLEEKMLNKARILKRKYYTR